jgi:transglutaminase-like putative cysteine protease
MLLPILLALAADPAGPPRERAFLFTYSAKVSGVEAGKTARVWLPVPPTTADQDVAVESKRLPAKEQLGRDPVYGNQILYFEAPAGADGTLSLELTYRVKRRERRAEDRPGAADETLLKRLLEADAVVPVGGKCLELLRDRKLPEDQAELGRLLYDVVNGHMRYSKEGTGWGRGDAEWACDSGRGNCSDFHSLFIALARAQKIPAVFECGFPLPEKRGEGEIGGYHCWALFRPAGKGWIPVDISEANKDPKKRDYYYGTLSEDRVMFSVGRDLTLAPKQAGGPLNFFVYPYVEVDGKALPAAQVKGTYRYRDLR